ncbi:Arsenical resistance operon repressor; DNA-binding transcriptional repressor ArsR [Thermobacillus xylanilyticus]|jgi:DNA-binding transcriptional ArsR family regulator|uniref:Arsenical resistance operon repressor DNA-binding transcriptional repressor ArsR n=1 Tax=Thermobacillus xylanilyticus TaxID=76633 RepID=A0ABM8V199_THEXY|nr:metalloregulator ArsR/SmtB family transcription factor [Thermobacillus xylanilyticus]REJ17964.1 MAG: transcriptional regulator [Paenibacillaceae bacterium]CAG5080634.1 Arsenical resistance operon repressor; DNA-binding transcriptional repressor ArsR [Thermobacillus xylanilyticus]
MNATEQNLKDAVKIYKALGEPTRLGIVLLLSRHANLSCTEIGERLNVASGSTLSHHLKQLADCGLIELSHKEGTYHYYRVRREVLERFVPPDLA